MRSLAIASLILVVIFTVGWRSKLPEIEAKYKAEIAELKIELQELNNTNKRLEQQLEEWKDKWMKERALVLNYRLRELEKANKRLANEHKEALAELNKLKEKYNADTEKPADSPAPE